MTSMALMCPKPTRTLSHCAPHASISQQPVMDGKKTDKIKDVAKTAAPLNTDQALKQVCDQKGPVEETSEHKALEEGLTESKFIAAVTAAKTQNTFDLFCKSWGSNKQSQHRFTKTANPLQTSSHPKSQLSGRNTQTHTSLQFKTGCTHQKRCLAFSHAWSDKPVG